MVHAFGYRTYSFRETIAMLKEYAKEWALAIILNLLKNISKIWAVFIHNGGWISTIGWRVFAKDEMR